MKNKLLPLLLLTSMLTGCVSANGANKGQGTGGQTYTNPTWPGEEIEEYLSECGVSDVLIPEITTGEFEGYYDEEYSCFIVQGADEGTVGEDSFEDQYATILTTANWTVDNSEYEEYGYLAYEDTDQVTLQFFTYEGYFTLAIYGGEIVETGAWPYEEVAEYLASYNIEGVSVPGLEGDTFTGYYFDLFGYYYITSVDEGTVGEDSLEDVYVTVLQEAGWTVDDSYYEDYGYIAYEESDSVEIEFYTADGYFECGIFAEYYYETGAWPYEAVAEYLSDCGIEDVSVPGLDGDTFYGYYDTYYDCFFIQSEDEEGELESAYADILTSAGWTLDDSEYDYYGIFAEEDSEQVIVQFYSYDGYFTCYIYPYEEFEEEEEEDYDTFYGEWPTETITSYLSTLDIEGIEVPAADGEEWYGGVGFDDYGEYFYLYIEDDGTIYDSYYATLSESWTKVEEETDWYVIFDDASETVEIEVDKASEDEPYTIVYIYGFESTDVEEETTDLGEGKYSYTVDFSAIEYDYVSDMGNDKVSIALGYGDNTYENDPIFKDGAARIYWGETLTFTVDGGTIDYVEIDYDTKSNGFTLTNGTTETTETEGTVKLIPTDNTQPLVLQVEGTKGNLKISSITVYYTIAE